MRRSIRTVLGLAAATASIAVAVPALSTAASASTLSSAPHHASSDYNRSWGTYSSSNGLARANGFIAVDYSRRDDNKTRVTGRLYDLDRRTSRQGGKCAYIQFRFQDFHGRWSTNSYKNCGTRGYKPISLTRYDVEEAQVRVCQAGLYNNVLTRCGSWRELYEADHRGHDWNDDHGHGRH